MVVVAVLIAGPSIAYAASEDQARAQAAMEDYFSGEERGGFLLVGMGVAGLVAGGVLRRRASATAKGASYLLLGMGVLHAIAGVYIYIASARRVSTFTEQIAREPEAFVVAERARMSGVEAQLSVLELVEGGLILGGLVLVVIGTRGGRPRLTGAGAALMIEAALTLGFDVLAARRASAYRDELAVSFVRPGAIPDD